MRHKNRAFERRAVYGGSKSREAGRTGTDWRRVIKWGAGMRDRPSRDDPGSIVEAFEHVHDYPCTGIHDRGVRTDHDACIAFRQPAQAPFHIGRKMLPCHVARHALVALQLVRVTWRDFALLGQARWQAAVIIAV